MAAKDLKVGDFVMVAGRPTELKSVDVKLERARVLRVTLSPDHPVEVITPGPSILSHAHKPRKVAGR